VPRSRHHSRKGRKEERRRSLHARVLQARKLHDTHIPDTSAWNALLNDTRRDDIVAALQNKVVIPTTVAISKIAATKDVAYRQGLLGFVKTVCRDIRPLASPNQLIIGASQGFARHDRSLLLNVGTEAEGSWIAINDPARVDEEAQRLAITFNREREELLIRHYNRNDRFMYDVVNPI